jgi:hypothetical protein
MLGAGAQVRGHGEEARDGADHDAQEQQEAVLRDDDPGDPAAAEAEGSQGC